MVAGANRAHFAELLDFSPLVVGEVAEERVIAELGKKFVHISST
jgi:hypothetical protein